MLGYTKWHYVVYTWNHPNENLSSPSLISTSLAPMLGLSRNCDLDVLLEHTSGRSAVGAHSAL
jgi:hypothetical protein